MLRTLDRSSLNKPLVLKYSRSGIKSNFMANIEKMLPYGNKKLDNYKSLCYSYIFRQAFCPAFLRAENLHMKTKQEIEGKLEEAYITANLEYFHSAEFIKDLYTLGWGLKDLPCDHVGWSDLKSGKLEIKSIWPDINNKKVQELLQRIQTI